MAQIIHGPFGQHGKQVNLFTIDEQPYLALLYQQGQAKGLFQRRVDIDEIQVGDDDPIRQIYPDPKISACVYFGDISDMDIPLLELFKLQCRQTGQIKYILSYHLLDKNGDLDMQSGSLHLEEFGAAYMNAKNLIEAGLGRDLDHDEQEKFKSLLKPEA